MVRMPKMPSRRNLLLATGAVLAAPSISHASTPLRWRLITSWNKNLAGPGISAQRLAERINALSAGRLEIEVFAAGQIVPAFGVFEAVSTGVAEMGHTASFFSEGKLPGVSLFTTAPFGMGALEHQTWIAERGGQALWGALYAPFGVRGFLASNTGPSMGGWFRKPIESLADIKGLRIRAQGLGGEVYARLGATPMAISPGDTGVALERGTIDAVELLAPVNDYPLGLHRYAKFSHMPGFNKPNGAAEALVNLKAFSSLPDDLKGVIELACQAEHAASLAEAERTNSEALSRLIGEGAKIVSFPADVLQGAHDAARDVLNDKAAASPMAGQIVASYRAAMEAGRNWARIEAYMANALRGGV